MIKLWLRGSAIAVLTATALLPVQEAAVARGGHSHGRMHGIGMPKATALPASAAPSAAAVSASPKVSLPVPVPAAAPAPTPASQIGAPAAQSQALAPLSPPVTPTTLTAGGAARTDSPSASSTRRYEPGFTVWPWGV